MQRRNRIDWLNVAVWFVCLPAIVTVEIFALVWALKLLGFL